MNVAINAAIIRRNELLLVRKNAVWILPGGKIEAHESDLECLCREMGEELSNTRIKNLVFYKEFSGKTPHSNRLMHARVYFADIDGELYGVRLGDSISEVAWMSNASQYPMSEITSQIVTSLKKDGYLKDFS